jgi:tetratricopeptide (TPR) repeat protein
MHVRRFASFAIVFGLLWLWAAALDARQPPRRIEQLPPNAESRRRTGGRWALVVGVDQYANRSIPPLSGAVADARAINDVLVNYADFPASQVLLLISDGTLKPTSAAIFEKLQEIKRSAAPGDLLLLYFAGHGVEVDGRRYLLTYDSRCCTAADIKSTGLLASALMQELESIKVAHRIVMVDACRNDPTKDGKQPNIADEGLETAFTLQPAAEGGLRATFLSSSRGQSAYEWTEKRRGFFSYFIEKGISGEAAQFGKVTVTSLLTYLNEMVPRNVREQKNQLQVPYAKVDGSELVLVSGAKLGRVEVALDRPASLSQRTIYGVVKDSGGAPLAGATITAVVLSVTRSVTQGAAADRVELAATADEDGFFKIDGVAANADANITVAKHGYLPKTLQCPVAEAGKKLVVFLPQKAPLMVTAGSGPLRTAGPTGATGAPAAMLVDRRAAELALVAYRTFLAEDFSEAENVGRQALAVDPENVLANAVVGNAMAALGVNAGDAQRTAGAMEFIRRALRADVKQPLAHNALGLTLVAENKFDEAISELGLAIRSDPTLGAAHANLAYVLLKQAEGSRNSGTRLKEAEKAYLEAIRLQPESSVPYNGLSNVLFSMGKYKDAVKACREAIGRYQLRDRILGLYYVQLAVAQFQDGRRQEALEAVGRAKALGITQHDVYATIEHERPQKKR